MPSQFRSMTQAQAFAIPSANLQNLDFIYCTDTRSVFIVLFNQLQLLTEFAAGIQNYLQGAAWHEGAGTPSVGLGKNGDFYLNGSNGDVYTMTLGSWGSPVCNIAGGGGGAVTSVAGRTGAVVLGESDITNLSSDLALKAPLASPALTGTPTAPTPTSSDNSTKIATTAFVQEVAGGGSFSAPVFPRSGAGPWRAWTGGYSIDGDYSSLGFIETQVYGPNGGGVGQFPVIFLEDSASTDGTAFIANENSGWVTKPYVKFRANIGGGPSASGYGPNTTYRAWLGLGNNISSTNWATDNPTNPIDVIAFRFSTAAGDTTIKCVVRNALSGVPGWLAPVVIDTGIVPDTNFHDFVINMSDGAHINFLIDGTQVAQVPLTAGPSGALFPNDYQGYPFGFVQGLSSATAYMFITYVYVEFPNS
jgi:hypothetical protein